MLNGNINENFRMFKQEINIYFKATKTNKEENEVQVARLLNLMGTEALKIYNTLNITESDTVEIILNKFEEYCSPKKNEAMTFYKFFTRNQQPDEAFDSFITSLKELVKQCDFKSDEDRILKSRVVLGIQNKDVQERLLREDLSLEKTLQYCRAVEAAEQNRKELEQSIEANKVWNIKEDKTKSKGTYYSSSNNKNNKGLNNNDKNKNIKYRANESQKTENSEKEFNCKRCGTTHGPRNCPAYGKECNGCHRIGHFKRCCRTLRAHTVRDNELETMSEENFSIDDLKIEEVDNQKTVSNNGTETWYKDLTVDSVKVKFKIDTGANVNVLPLYYIDKNKQKEIKQSKIKLYAFGGTSIDALGKIQLKCKIINKNEHLDTEVTFVVIKEKLTPILSLKTSVELGLVKRIDVIKTNNANEISSKKNMFYEKNKDIFTGLGCFPDICEIKLREGSIPKALTARRIPIKIKDKFKTTLHMLEQKRIIIPVNEPVDWVNRLQIVEKPNGSLRLCIDPIYLNKAIIKEMYTIPTLEELAPKLSHKAYYSVFDIKDGFYHIQLNEVSSKYCSFNTIYGTYRFLRAPFGLKNIPEFFQKLVYKYFGDISGVTIYVDDILISAYTIEEHDNIVNKVIQRARDYNIKFNFDKIQYCVQEVKYLGMIFNKNGMKSNPDKIQVIKELEYPSNKLELQRFLGMIGFLRNFIPNMSKITEPLRQLLKKDNMWVWSEKCANAIDSLKNIIISNKVLAPFDVRASVQIYCDASKSALGSCLMQNNRPVYFASRSLNKTESEYAQIEKELLAITFSCKKFHNYIYGHGDVTIYTDHMPLTSIINKTLDEIQNNRIKRLRLKLIIYNFNLKYIPGKKNVIGDFLSRLNIKTCEEEDIQMRDIVHTVGIKNVQFSDEKLKLYQEETVKDNELKLVHEYYFEGWTNIKGNERNELKHYVKIKNDIEISDGLIYYKKRLIVPKTLRRDVLKLLHETHLGFNKTYIIARELFYWPAITYELKSFIGQCKTCNIYSKSQTKKSLINHYIPEIPFMKVGIDIAEYAGNNFLILVDYLSKWLEVEVLKNKTSAECISKLKKIFSIHGIPEIVVADNMPFDSYECKQFSKEWNFTFATSSPNYPKSNGQSEKAVGIIKDMLKKCKNEGVVDFELFKLNYNNSPVGGLNFSPAQILMSRRLRTKLPYKMEDLKPKVLCDEAYKLIRKGKDKLTKYYNKTSLNNNIEFMTGEKVWIQDVKSKLWSEGSIVKTLPLRSYLVKMDKNNRVVRRNDIFIKKVKTFQRLDKEDEIKETLNEKKEEVVLRKSQRKKKVPDRYGLNN